MRAAVSCLLYNSGILLRSKAVFCIKFPALCCRCETEESGAMISSLTKFRHSSQLLSLLLTTGFSIALLISICPEQFVPGNPDIPEVLPHLQVLLLFYNRSV